MKDKKMNDTKYDFCFLYYPHFYEVDPGAQLGLGPLLLATYVKRLGATVKVINIQSETLFISFLEIPKCKNLMLYGCIIDVPVIKKVVEYTRRFADNIFLGGPVAKGDLNFEVDRVIDGYGEDFIWDLLHGGNCGGEYPSLRKNINDYPFPDRGLLAGYYGGNIFKNSKLNKGSSTTILTSRGCRYKCAFCTSGLDKFYQDYDISRMEKEIEDCLSLGIKNIRISDDNLIRDNKRLYILCRLFKEAGVKWRASVRTYPNSVELYTMMRENGCEELSFGIESGDQDVLNLLKKKAMVEQNARAIINANKAGIGMTRALIMMGTPGESSKTLLKNKRWVKRAQPKMVSLKMFVPYPGTDIYNKPQDYNCRIEFKDGNNSAYRPDNSEPQSNITNIDPYMSSDELTGNFFKMKLFLEERGLENRG